MLTILSATGVAQQREHPVTKPALIIVLGSLLAGCVTSNDQYSQTAARSVARQHSTPAAYQASKEHDSTRTPVMLGAAY
jgi:hypothetical protein